MKSHFLVIVLLFLVIELSSAATRNTLTVSDNDLIFRIHSEASFAVLTSDPVAVDTYIHFNYSESTNVEPLPDGIVIPKGQKGNIEYNVTANTAGHSTILVNSSPSIKRSNAFVRVGVYKLDGLITFSSVIGWLYFICWSVSFYPQAIQNFQRKSVVGLNFDFLGLNLTGFIAYSVFNIGLKYIKEVQSEYHSIHPTGIIPVETNDVVFAVHATFITAVTIGQCFIYERGDQLISRLTVATLALIWSTAAVWLLLTALSVIKTTPWLNFLYFFSYVKLGITLIKYVPQVVFNYQRKSTVGWSIGTVLFDIVGGVFSIMQMFIIAYNFEDWYSLMGNFTKLGLGIASITFDVIFMTQHYILYRNRQPEELSPIIDRLE